MSPNQKMTRDEEYEFYARPENQEPQGPARRCRSQLTEMVPVRSAPKTLEEVRDCADADDRSVSAWIRRAVEHELERQGRGNASNELLRTDPDDAGRRPSESLNGAFKASDPVWRSWLRRVGGRLGGGAGRWRPRRWWRRS